MKRIQQCAFVPLRKTAPPGTSGRQIRLRHNGTQRRGALLGREPRLQISGAIAALTAYACESDKGADVIKDQKA